jgi:zinc/manganese transport system permease protein
MFEAFSLMIWPLLACFVLVGIHAYLGIHVIARKVIFVDLALAQIAALGAVYGVYVGLSLAADWWLIKGISVTFTLVGALLFSFTRTNDERVPHEAVIGIIYAAALSMVLLLTANLAHGGDEIHQLLSGNILWVTPHEVMYTAALYSVVGLIHVLFRRQFFMLSWGESQKQNLSFNVKVWDFLFYATFGVVVTSSVGMGGVLLVFAYLVIPSVIGIMLAESTKSRLLLGWASGLLMSLVGVIVSYYLDLPSGPTIVVLLGLLLLVIALVLEIKDKARRKSGFLHLILVLSLASVVAVVPIVFWGGQDHDDHGLAHQDHQEKDSLAKVSTMLSSPDDKERVHAISELKSLGDQRAIALLIAAATTEQDPFIVIDIGLALLSLKNKEGFLILQKIIDGNFPELAREDAAANIKEWLLDAPSGMRELSLWLTVNHKKIRFDEPHNKFLLAPILNQ